MRSHSATQAMMTQASSRLMGKERDGRVPVALATYGGMNTIQSAVACEASYSVTSCIPSGPTT